MSAQFFVDGQDAFTDLTAELQRASTSVILAGWWFGLDAQMDVTNTQTTFFDLISKLNATIPVFVVINNLPPVFAPVALGHKTVIRSLRSIRQNIHVIRARRGIPGLDWPWTFHQKLVIIDYKVAFFGGLDLCYGRADTNAHPLFTSSLLGLNRYHPEFRAITANDYPLPVQVIHPIVQQAVAWRQPFHDVHAKAVGGSIVHELLAYFFDYWNSRCTTLQFAVARRLPLLSSPLNAWALRSVYVSQHLRFGWTRGQVPGMAPFNALVRLITSAQHLLYIEAQFFMCALGSYPQVLNCVADMICWQMQQQQSLQVIIVLPCYPEGKIDTATLSMLDCTRNTISAMRQHLGNQSSRLNVFALIQQELDIGGNLLSGPSVFNQVYVHSKLAIADDTSAVIGSANINDRSQLGHRDAELAIFINDPVEVSKLRRTLMNEHCGTVGRFVLPLSAKQAARDVKLLQKRAQRNSRYLANLKQPVYCGIVKFSQLPSGKFSKHPIRVGMHGRIVDYDSTFLQDPAASRWALPMKLIV